MKMVLVYFILCIQKQKTSAPPASFSFLKKTELRVVKGSEEGMHWEEEREGLLTRSLCYQMLWVLKG